VFWISPGGGNPSATVVHLEKPTLLSYLSSESDTSKDNETVDSRIPDAMGIPICYLAASHLLAQSGDHGDMQKSAMFAKAYEGLIWELREVKRNA